MSNLAIQASLTKLFLEIMKHVCFWIRERVCTYAKCASFSIEGLLFATIVSSISSQWMDSLLLWMRGVDRAALRKERAERTSQTTAATFSFPCSRQVALTAAEKLRQTGRSWHTASRRNGHTMTKRWHTRRSNPSKYAHFY